MQIRDIEFWTSGTQAECKGKLRWCSLSKRFTRRNVTWAANEDGDCLSIQFLKNASILAKTACDKQLNFICEVQKVTFSRNSDLKFFDSQTMLGTIPTIYKMNAWKCGTLQLVWAKILLQNVVYMGIIVNLRNSWHACFRGQLQCQHFAKEFEGFVLNLKIIY